MANIEKRISSNGQVSYRVTVRIKGYPRESATFKKLTDARKWEQLTEANMRQGRHFKTSVSKKHSVADLITRYLKYLEKQNPKRHADVKPKLDWWKKEIGNCTLSDVSKAIITVKRELLLSEEMGMGKEKWTRSPATVNRYISVLSHVFAVAVNEWELIENHPMRNLSKLKEPRGRVRFLDDKERTKLLDACKLSKHPSLYTIVVLALSTGARRGEITNLRWSDVDFKRKIITLHETKNGERRILPLTGHAFDCMKRHEKIRRIDTDFVFPSSDPNQVTNLQFYWYQAIKKAQISDFRFHDLRHSAASYLAMNGASLAEIAEVLGHKTLQMVKRYAHLSEAHTSEVVASMNERIFG
jgi:integrase